MYNMRRALAVMLVLVAGAVHAGPPNNNNPYAPRLKVPRTNDASRYQNQMQRNKIRPDRAAEQFENVLDRQGTIGPQQLQRNYNEAERDHFTGQRKSEQQYQRTMNAPSQQYQQEQRNPNQYQRRKPQEESK